MPAPTSQNAYVRPDLNVPFLEYEMMGRASQFVGAQILPYFEAGVAYGEFPRLAVGELRQKTGDLSRAMRGAYKRVHLSTKKDTFNCTEAGVEELIDDRERVVYANSFQADVIQAQRAIYKVMEDHDKKVAALCAPGNFAGQTTAVSSGVWTNNASKPIEDITNAVKQVRKQCGMNADTVLLSWPVWLVLQDHPQIIDRIKYSGIDDPKQVSLNALATLFKVHEVLVADNMENTAGLNLPVSFADIFDPAFVMVFKKCRTGSLEEPGLGRTFHFAGDGSSTGVAFEMYRDESKRSDVLRARQDRDEKLLLKEAAHFVTGTGVTS